MGRLYMAMVFAALWSVSFSFKAAAQEPELADDALVSNDAVTMDANEEISAEAEIPEEVPVLVVRLSDALEPEQREAVLGVIEALPTVVVGDNATHEIGPNPSLSDIVALYEIPGTDPRAALAPSLVARGISTPEQLFEFFADDFRAEHSWASNLAPPIELGDIEGEGFAARLNTALLAAARREAVADFAGGDSDGAISVCFSNEPAPAGYCPLPREGLAWNEASNLAPIYLSVEAKGTAAPFFSVAAMDRAGAIIPLASGEGIPYSFAQAIGPESDPAREADDARLFFAPAAPLNELLAPGHYDLIVILAEEPVPPEIWLRENNGADPAQLYPERVCPETLWIGLCRAMQVRWGRMPLLAEGDTARVRVAVRTELRRISRVVIGAAATRSVSLWQAQLFRYRAEDAAEGARTFDFKKAHRCGGAYLGNGFVLTAAHCIPRDVSEMRVRLGARKMSAGGKSFKVRSLVQHSRGNSPEARVDLAVLQLRASPASLRALGSDLMEVSPSTNADPEFSTISGLTATGWGLIKPRLPGESGWTAADGSRNEKADTLQQVVLVQKPDAECTARSEYSAYRTRDMLCLRGLIRGSDTCAGDSGGPVTARASGGRELVGIVSTGVGCAFKGVPAVYVNVAEHRGWIDRAREKMLSSRPGYYEME